jgi:hypothetical protein
MLSVFCAIRPKNTHFFLQKKFAFFGKGLAISVFMVYNNCSGAKWCKMIQNGSK